MNAKLARRLTRLYPRHWRNRYGAEFEALLQTGRGDMRTLVNVAWSALHEHFSPTPGLKTNQHPHSFLAITKQPSAFLPLAMSLAAFAVVLGAVITSTVHETDEGTAAHLWQLLMAAQVPMLAFFLIRWLPRAPRRTLQILALQAGAVLANIAAVFFSGAG